MPQSQVIPESMLRELQRRAEAMARGDLRDLGGALDDPAADAVRRAIDVLGEHTAQAQRNWNASLAALTAAQEAERSRIARELHDDTVQRLIALGHGIERVRNLLPADPAQADTRLEGLRADVTAAVQALRQVIADLRPPALDDLGLQAALELLLRRPPDELPTTTFNVSGRPRRMDGASELAAFRIVQEAMNNVRRHAGAERAHVAVEYRTNGLFLTVTDDGRGFDPAASAPGGRGITGMHERAMLVNGNVTIQSKPGQGTRVEALLPYLADGGRDPICGMETAPDALTAEHEGLLYRFCSAACRELFLEGRG